MADDTPTNDKPRRRFICVANDDLARLPVIGPQAWAVYCVLAKHCDADRKCFPSIETIAEACGRSKRQIFEPLQILVREGLVRIESGQGKTTNTYHLPTLPRKTGDEENRTAPDVGMRNSALDPCGKPHVCGEENLTSVVRNSAHRTIPIEQDPLKEEKTCCARRARPLTYTDDDLTLAKEMAAAAEAVQKPAKTPDLHKWANTIRLMRESDNRTLDDIRQLFHWATADSFWRANIRSPEKLREKWDTLSLHKARPQNGNGKPQRQALPNGPGHKYDPAAVIGTGF